VRRVVSFMQVRPRAPLYTASIAPPPPDYAGAQPAGPQPVETQAPSLSATHY